VSKIAVVSFEGNIVKIVHALRKGKKTIIERAEEVSDEEFDDYLQKEKAKDFIVTREFSNASHEILVTPVLKSQYLEKYIESEIRKTTGEKNFTFVYAVTGEQFKDNKKMLEVHYYMVSKEKLQTVIERFQRNGKVVRAFYPSVYSAAALLDQGGTDEAVMGIFGTSNKRIAFITKKGAIRFIRNYESMEAEFSDLDIQNMYMTIKYCEQNIQINPSTAMIQGVLAETNTATTLPEVPLASMRKAENIECTREEFNNYFLPLASLFAPGSANILNAEYKHLYMLKQFMVNASKAFTLIAVISLCLIFYKAVNIIDMREKVQTAVEDQSDAEAIYTDFRSRADMLDKVTTAVEFLNSPSSDLHRMLIDFTGVKMQHIYVDSISASANDSTSFIVTISGTSLVQTYASFQLSFDSLVNVLKEIKGMQIRKKTINIQNKYFKVEAVYRKA
jgi:hypothetical protein